MQCPNDNEILVMSERQGVEIDYCPKCRGIWLDRGELDKIIEKSTTQQSQPANYSTQDSDRHNDRSSYNEHDDQKNDSGKKRKKENFLSDIFDF